MIQNKNEKEKDFELEVKKVLGEIVMSVEERPDSTLISRMI